MILTFAPNSVMWLGTTVAATPVLASVGNYTIADVALTMDDKGNYIMNGTINSFDAMSGTLKTTILEPQMFPSMAMEGYKIGEMINQILINQQRNIEAIQNSNRSNSQNKIFNPEELLQQLLQQ
jgi:hypothetical protein